MNKSWIAFQMRAVSQIEQFLHIQIAQPASIYAEGSQEQHTMLDQQQKSALSRLLTCEVCHMQNNHSHTAACLMQVCIVSAYLKPALQPCDLILCFRLALRQVSDLALQ